MLMLCCVYGVELHTSKAVVLGQRSFRTTMTNKCQLSEIEDDGPGGPLPGSTLRVGAFLTLAAQHGWFPSACHS